MVKSVRLVASRHESSLYARGLVCQPHSPRNPSHGFAFLQPHVQSGLETQAISTRSDASRAVM